MTALRVVQVVHSDGFAGVERYVAGLAKGLSSAGVSSVVIGGDKERMLDDLGSASVRWLPGDNPRAVLSSLLKARRTDIIHAHMTEAELAAITVAPLCRARVVTTRHFAQPRGSSLPGRMVGRVITRRVAAQLAIGDFTASRVEGPSIVIPPATALVAADAPHAADRDKTVLIAQRLEPEKRTDLGLRVWAASRLADRGWRLQVAGHGSCRPALDELAAALGIQASVDFLGEVRQIGQVLARAAILLAPRPDEPFGISVIEAMAASLPVVAAAGGGHLETIGRVPGAALYLPGDLATAGRVLLELAEDAHRRESYAQAGRDVHRARFTVAAQVAATLEVYRSVLR